MKENVDYLVLMSGQGPAWFMMLNHTTRKSWFYDSYFDAMNMYGGGSRDSYGAWAQAYARSSKQHNPAYKFMSKCKFKRLLRETYPNAVYTP